MPVVYIGTYNLEYAWGGRAKLERDGSMTIVSREGNNIYSLLRVSALVRCMPCSLY